MHLPSATQLSPDIPVLHIRRSGLRFRGNGSHAHSSNRRCARGTLLVSNDDFSGRIRLHKHTWILHEHSPVASPTVATNAVVSVGHSRSRCSRRDNAPGCTKKCCAGTDQLIEAVYLWRPIALVPHFPGGHLQACKVPRGPEMVGRIGGPGIAGPALRRPTHTAATLKLVSVCCASGYGVRCQNLVFTGRLSPIGSPVARGSTS